MRATGENASLRTAAGGRGLRVLNTEATRSAERRWASLAASLVLHVVGLFLAAITWPDPKEREKPLEVVELALVSEGERDVEAPPAPREPRPQPPTTSAPPSPRLAPPAPVGELAPQTEPAPPESFAEWQARRRSRYLPPSTPYAAGRVKGQQPLNRPGRRNCDPVATRAADRVYLLFDSSGSMSGLGHAQALRCAQQYASGALARGAEIVVANFARDVKFSEPTRKMLDVQIALRALTDPTQTRLPSRELQRFFQQLPDAPADLVIISDGWFVPEREVLTWYRFFLELHPENRGVMYTVGNRGARDAVTHLRGLGFDVHAYEPTSGQ